MRYFINLLFFGFLSIFFIFNLFSEVIVSDYVGDVKYRKNSFSKWEDISQKGFIIPDGGAVKTGSDGKAKILIDKSTIWLKENTAIECEVTSKYFTSIGLVYGKIKSSILGLARKSRFQIKTVSAVFGIRGTDIMIQSSMEGKSAIDVLFGEVEFVYTIPPKKGPKNFIITQGMSFYIEDVEKPYNFGLITKEKEREILSNWDPSASETNAYEGIDEREKKINRLKNFIAYSNEINYEFNRFTYKERESDFEAGRTLKDLSGNTVRVDQRIIRPDANTLQMFNIVKRENYKNYEYATSYSSNRNGFLYNGGSVPNRLDSFIITFNFNKRLPVNINDWQGFFSDSSLKANWATFVTANMTSANKIFFVGEAYKYNTLRDELINNTEVVGVPQNSNERDNDVVITGVIEKTFLDDIVNFNFQEKNLNDPTGNLIRKSDGKDINAIWGIKTGEGFEINGDTKLYQIKGDKYLKGDIQNPSDNDYFWLTQENYLISNSGKIKDKSDITSSNKTAGEIIKETAVQSIIYVKKDSNNNVSNDDYFLDAQNIDNVIIGDVPFYVFEKISTGVNKFKD
ncbi:MAG: FecR family protein [Elusimicrobiota bacterium]